MNVLVAATGWMNANKIAYFFFKPMAVNGRKGDFCLLATSSGKQRDHHSTEEISTIHYCWIMPANDISTMPNLQNPIGHSCSTIIQQLSLSNPLWCATFFGINKTPKCLIQPDKIFIYTRLLFLISECFSGVFYIHRSV